MPRAVPAMVVPGGAGWGCPVPSYRSRFVGNTQRELTLCARPQFLERSGLHPRSGPGTLAINVNYGWQNDVGTSVTDNGNFVVESYGLLGAAVSWSELSLWNLPGSTQLCFGGAIF